VDLRRRLLLANISVGQSPVALALKPDGGELFVANRDSHSVSVINTWSNEVTETLLASRQPVQVLTSGDGSQLYVAHAGSDLVFVVDIPTRRVLGSVQVGRQPSTAWLTPDGRTLLVASIGSNDLAVVRTTARALADLLPLEFEPRAIAVVPVPVIEPTPTE